MATNIQALLFGILLVASILMISGAIVLFWVKICYQETCLKRSRRLSIVMGLLGWALYLVIVFPVL